MSGGGHTGGGAGGHFGGGGGGHFGNGGGGHFGSGAGYFSGGYGSLGAGRAAQAVAAHDAWMAGEGTGHDGIARGATERAGMARGTIEHEAMARGATEREGMARESVEHESAAHKGAPAHEQVTKLAAVRPPTTPHPHPHHPKPMNVNLNSVQYSSVEMRAFAPCFNRPYDDSYCFGRAIKAPVNSDTGRPIG